MHAILADPLVSGPALAFGSVLAASLGVPVPSFAVLIFVGSLFTHMHGKAEGAALVFVAAMLGAAIGDVTWFEMGRRFGGRVLGLLCRMSLSRDSCIRRTADFFTRRGMRLFLVARFVPGLSTVSAPLAGAAGVGLGRFLAFAETGAALWIATSLLLGFWLANQVGLLLAGLRHFGLDVGGAAAMLVAAYVLVRWYRRRQLLRRLRMARITAPELAGIILSGLSPVIIDARAEYQRRADPVRIAGALMWQDIESSAALPDLSRTGPVVIYCACPNEASAALIARRMHALGFDDVRPLQGGLDAWRDAGQPVLPLSEAAARAPARGVEAAAL